MNQGKARQMAIFAHSGDFDRLYQVATLAASAAANGEEVHIILFFDALRKFVEDRVDEMSFPASYGEEGERIAGRMKEARAHSVSDLIESARQVGKVVLYACASQVKFMGYTAREVEGVVDEVISLPVFLSRTQGAETKLFI